MHSHTACMGDKLGGLLVTDGGVQLREAEEAYQQPDVPRLKREETVFQGDTSGRGLGYKHTGLGCRLVRDKRRETPQGGGSNHTCRPSHHRRRGQTKRREGKGAPAASRTMAQISGVRTVGYISQLGVCVHKGRRPRQDCDGRVLWYSACARVDMAPERWLLIVKSPKSHNPPHTGQDTVAPTLRACGYLDAHRNRAQWPR
jgi:hypothetical protein